MIDDPQRYDNATRTDITVPTVTDAQEQDERLTLVAMLEDPDRIPELAAIAGPAQFGIQIHVVLARTLVDLHAETGTASLDLLLREVKKRPVEVPDDWTWQSFLLGLLDHAYVPAAAVVHAKRVRKAWADRQGRRLIMSLIARANSEDIDLREEFESGLAEISSWNLEGENSGPDFAWKTFGQLGEAPPPRTWLITDFLEAGQFCFIGGESKTLKTSVALSLAMSLACGEKFLRRFDVPKLCRVAICSGEIGAAMLWETTNRIGRAIDMDPAALGDRVVISEVVPDISDDMWMNRLERDLKAHKSDVLIVDPFFQATMNCPDASTSGSRMYSLLGKIKAMGKRCNCTIIMIHHLKKAGVKTVPFAPPDRTDLAGAGVVEFVRQWLLLGRRSAWEDGASTHELWLRYGGSHQACGLLALDVDERVGDRESGYRWEANAVPASQHKAKTEDAKQQERTTKARSEGTERREKVIAFLKTRTTAPSFSAIERGTGLSRSPLERTMAEMVEGRFVQVTTITKGKATYDVYELLSDEDWSTMFDSPNNTPNQKGACAP